MHLFFHLNKTPHIYLASSRLTVMQHKNEDTIAMNRECCKENIENSSKRIKLTSKASRYLSIFEKETGERHFRINL